MAYKPEPEHGFGYYVAFGLFCVFVFILWLIALGSSFTPWPGV